MLTNFDRYDLIITARKSKKFRELDDKVRVMAFELGKKNPKINALFAFPAIENFAMSSLGYLSIFKQIDLMEDVYVERYYSNSKTTQIMLENVDVIGFSMSFEMDIFQVIKMLEKLNIPLFANAT